MILYTFNSLKCPHLTNIRRFYPISNTHFNYFKSNFNTASNVNLSKKIITPEFLTLQSHKGHTLIYIANNDNISESDIKSKYCSKDAKLFVTNIKNVDQRVVCQYEITTLPTILRLKNGIVSCENNLPAESNLLKKDDKLTLCVNSLEKHIRNIKSDLNSILSELAGLITRYSSLFSTRGELVQLAAAAAIAFSDIPQYSLDELHAIATNGELVPLKNEVSVLVDSIFQTENPADLLSSTSKSDANNYSPSQYKARLYRAISSRYFRLDDSKAALEYAYKSLQLDIEHQNSMIDTENVTKLDPYKIDIFSESIATIFIKHLIIALGDSSEVLDVRSKVEFMFRDTKYVPLKLKSNRHPPGGPPMKGRGYRAKWIWHGMDYRPRGYKPRNIYKYHDEWRAVHDEPVINY